MGKCACSWLIGANSLEACSGGRGQTNVAHRQTACQGDECLAKGLMGCWSLSMRLCHEPWLEPHWFLSVKRWKKNLSFFYTLVSPVLQEVVFREDSEKNGLGVAPRSCFGVQGGCFLSSLSEGSALPLLSSSSSSPLSSHFPMGSNKGQ